MTVIVDQCKYAAALRGHFAVALEASANAVEFGERLDDRCVGCADFGGHRDCRQCIQYVVHAGVIQCHIQIGEAFAYDAEAHLAIIEARIHRAYLRRFVKAIGGDRFGNLRENGAHIGVVETHHRHAVERQPLAKIHERLFQLFEIMVIGVHVIGVDIGDDRNHGRQV